MTVCIRVLGPLAVEVDGQGRPVGGVTQRTVLALLAASVGEVVPVDELVEGTWGAAAPADASHALQSQVSRIRQALDGDGRAVVARTTAGYRLQLPEDGLDAAVFTRLAARVVAAGDAGDSATVIEVADAALATWRGAPFHDVRESPRVRAEAVRLEELRNRLLELRARAALATGRAPEVVPDLIRLVEDHPFRETAWGLLARALDASGRRHEALARLRDLRRLLQDELGTDPGREIDRLYTRILLEDAGGSAPAGDRPAPPLPPPLAATLRGPWVGRQEDVDTLVATWRDATRTVVALVSGEAGIGKTRLAAELARRVVAAGGRVHHGGCTRELGVPHEPFVELLDGASWADAHAPPESLVQDPAARRRAVTTAIADRVTRPDEVGTLFVLDDLHWSDAGTLDVLTHLARRPAPGRRLVLGLFRDTDVGSDHPLVRAQADLRRHGLALHLRLTGLDVDAVVQLVEALPGAPVHDARSLAVRVREACEGNPFFVTAVLGQLASTAGGDGLIGPIPVPGEVRDVVADRLAGLPPGVVVTLETAALLEPVVDVHLLAPALDRGVDEVIADLDVAADAGLATEVGLGAYRFSHDLVRTAVLERQSRSRRARRHRAVAAVLEHRRGHPADLAHHLRHAGDDDTTRRRAAAAAMAAGDAALRAWSPSDALAHFTSAVDLLAPVDAPAAGRRARLGLGIAARDAGRPDHREILLELARSADAAGDDEVLVAAALANHRGMWSSLAAPDTDRVEVLDRALARARTDRERARVLARLAIEVVFAPGRDPATLVDRAAGLADHLDPDVQAEVRFAQVTAGWRPDRAAELHRIGCELVGLARDADDRVALAHALMWHGVHLRTVGRTAQARAALAEACALADELDHDTLRLFGSGYRCAQAMLEGDASAAQVAADAALHHGQATGQPDIGDWYVSMLAVLRLAQGRLHELYPQILARHEQGAPVAAIRSFQAARVLALDDAGRRSEARAVWRCLVDEAADAPRDFIWLQTAALLALASQAGEDPERARVLHDLVAPLVPQFVNGGVVMWGALDHTVALLADAAGDREGATTAFDRAEREQHRAGARLWQVHTAIARAVHDRQAGVDPAKVSERLALAATEARRLGCPDLAERAARLHR